MNVNKVKELVSAFSKEIHSFYSLFETTLNKNNINSMLELSI